MPLNCVRFAAVALMLVAFVAGARADLTFRPSGEHGLRITLATNEADVALNPALVDTNWSKAVLRLKAGETRKRARVGKLRVSVTANPLTVKVEDAKGRLLQEVEFSETNGVISFPLGDAPVLGLGEGGDQFDRRGFNFRLINGQSYKLAELGTRIFTPFLLGTKGWALLVGTPYGGFDLRGERGIFTPVAGSKPGVADVFVIDASNPAYAMEEYVRLTGAPVMPPKWALGYMQSHRTLSNEVDVLAELKLFRDRKLPCDTMIYLGTGFCTNGWNYSHDSFEFNNRVFTRDAAAVIKDFHDLNFHIALHVVPQDPRRNARELYPSLHGNIPPAPGEVLDALNIGTYWKRHVPLVNAGVDGWWPDEGDWLDVPSRLARHRMYYEGPLSTTPNVRPWDLQRNGYMGIAQYGGYHWSGDISSSWKTFAAQVEVGQNSSMSVSPFWGTDTGGFYPPPTREYTGELYVRWFEFSTFCPSFRSHGRTWRLHTPWGWDLGETGPVESRPPPDPSELHNTAVEPICRDYLNLRYQLMPYTYTITREAHDTGMPMMRALWLNYPGDSVAVTNGSEYMWGKDLLVAPVTEKAATSRDVYLPAGDWYDWWTNEKTQGKRSVARAVDLKTMPIYVRAGAVIPFDPVRQYVDQAVTEPTTIRVYRGADGRFVMYDDDGKSLDYLKQGAGTWTSFAWSDSGRKLEIKLDKRTGTKPEARDFDVLLLPDNQRKTVHFTGKTAVIKF